MKVTAALRRHPGRSAIVGALLVALMGLGLYWFAPWNLFVDRRVDETLPGAQQPVDGTAADDGAAAEDGATDGNGATQDGGSGLETLASGGFAGLEHETAGTALVVELEDGTRVLRLEDLETSNGPDLRVIITEQPLSDDWGIWDDGAYVDLGPLKGNLGSSNYELPADVVLEDFETVVIWCRRFSVGFGVAPLEPAA
jgi:hypothetical protein